MEWVACWLVAQPAQGFIDVQGAACAFWRINRQNESTCFWHLSHLLRPICFKHCVQLEMLAQCLGVEGLA